MEENSTMILIKEQEEIELDLGLSIGGGFKNSVKLNRTQNQPDVPKNSGFDTDLPIESKRETEALRRQEAKRKRREKQQNNRTLNNGGYGVGFDKKMMLKSSELETKELELDMNEQECKKSRVEEEEENCGTRCNNNMEMKNLNLNQNVVGFNSTVHPVMYPYPPVQYVQFANGFQYPCLNVMPCWAAGGGADVVNDQSTVQSVVGRSVNQESDHNMGNGCASDQNSRKAGSNGTRSFSAVLDYRSSSHEGGGSSETRSHSSHSLPEQLQLHNSKANETKGQSEHSASSHLRETAQVYDETTNCSANCGKPNTSSNTTAQCNPSANFVEQKFPSNAADCQTIGKDEAATGLQEISSHNPVSTTEVLPPGVSMESKEDRHKPPKPQTRNQYAPPLPHMPCVSTTGEGPKGKTINGFLYRYTKTEVSIICVCHGTSFSPAEFVQHAGGTDVSHPLKHITVMPSAF